MSVECPKQGCAVCVKSCQISPCYGPPEEIQRIIDAGFGDRLSARLTPSNCVGIMPASKGSEGGQYSDGECTFLDANGKCELHSLGLKPMIGRILDCQDYSELSHDFQTEVGFQIIAEWETESGFNVAKQWLEKHSKELA